MANVPLHKSPRGLLEGFRLQTLGRQPDEFSLVLQPSVDVREFYVADLLGVEQAAAPTVGAINAAPGLSSVGPWLGNGLLYGVGGVFNAGAAPGTWVNWQASVTLPDTDFIALGNGEFRPVAAGVTRIFSAILPVPLVLIAGAVLTITVFGDGGGADHSIQARTLWADLRPR